MQILQFTKKKARLTGGEEARLRDWTQGEMADFYRAQRLLSQQGIGIGLDSGLSDAGDPWMVFFDLGTQDVFMHVARIDGRCLLACDALGLFITDASIAQLISSLEAEVCKIMAVRQSQKSNVVFHPAAKIILSIAAVFLLFKLENGGTAHAKSLDGEAPNNETLHRNHESGVSVRTQTAFSRLFDAVDSPAAVAALAGALISVEFALSQNQASTSFNGDEYAEPVTSSDHPHAVGLSALNVAEMGADSSRDRDPSSSTDPEPNPLHSLVEWATTAAIVPFATGDGVPARGSMAPEHNEKWTATWKALARSDTFEPFSSSTVVDVSSAKEVDDQSDAKDSTGLSQTLAEEMFTAVMAELDDPDAANGIRDNVSPGSESALDVSFASLEQLRSIAAFVSETELSTYLLQDALTYFLSKFEDYVCEVDDSGVFIEQVLLTPLESEDIGIWTNQMSDGSMIAIVGQVDLIDDIAVMFG